MPDGRDGGHGQDGPAGGVGVTARAGALVLAVVLAVATSGPRLGVALALSWLLAAAIHPAAFLVLRRWTVWGLVAALALPPLAFVTPRDLALPLGAAVSSEAVRLSLTMAGRALVIVVAAAGFGATVSVRELTDLLEVAGLRGLGFSLGVAVHALPIARRTWATSARALRLRGGLRRARLRDLVLLAVTVVANALRHADEVVEAALARGFEPSRRRGTGPPRWRTDLAWLCVWALVAAIVIAV